uniref:Uncharacterized protein n=1 Tax=Candidatus Kentrum sp. TUN TaxID=2126343 RepID=A0A450ZI84_9GAMM|nr:MAG: hypothetical protein BECKTUN1418D_GA0071000_101613 [Candidatus Kentron sp. TUN]VFK52961.1 MAG: hypothetical protein BECKTUN1418F_GA0071002_101521 [Candidatus Kentron sp. TUN]VFK53512.1 MAG: hypothetical protein BECKTUN1418E_GA0071001_101722 [Candidatus Kentron sp. TUN]
MKYIFTEKHRSRWRQNQHFSLEQAILISSHPQCLQVAIDADGLTGNRRARG